MAPFELLHASAHNGKLLYMHMCNSPNWGRGGTPNFGNVSQQDHGTTGDPTAKGNSFGDRTDKNCPWLPFWGVVACGFDTLNLCSTHVLHKKVVGG